MCNPALAMGGQVAGASLGAINAYAQAGMQRSTLRSQARIAEINATMSDAAARSDLQTSERQQQAIRLKGANVKGSQRAAIAASGVDLNSTSAQAALATTDYFTEADAITAEANGVRAAWGHRIEAGNTRRGAAAARLQAKGISPLLAGATSLIGSASQLSKSAYQFDQSGGFGSMGSKLSVPTFDPSLANGALRGGAAETDLKSWW